MFYDIVIAARKYRGAEGYFGRMKNSRSGGTRDAGRGMRDGMEGARSLPFSIVIASRYRIAQS
jgi:hypothetical protein